MKISSKIRYGLALAIFSIICICIYLSNTKSNITPTTKYTYNIYENKEELLSSSKLIIHGTVLNSKVKNINIASDDLSPFIVEYKVASILVTDVIKGDTKIGETIEVKYPNSDENEISYTLDTLISIDNDCLLFLSTYENFDSDMPYSIVNPMQGVITLNMYENIDYTPDTSLNLFNDIPKENIVDYLKNNI